MRWTALWAVSWKLALGRITDWPLLVCIAAMDGSKTGSGGKQGDYQMETESAKWQLERNDPAEVENQVRSTS